MLILENTLANRRIQQAAATLAIEDMYLDEDFLAEVLKVDSGEKTSEQLIHEVLLKHAG